MCFVINICKQKAKINYFDIGDIFPTFAEESVLKRLKLTL